MLNATFAEASYCLGTIRQYIRHKRFSPATIPSRNRPRLRSMSLNSRMEYADTSLRARSPAGCGFRSISGAASNPEDSGTQQYLKREYRSSKVTTHRNGKEGEESG